MFTEYLGIKTGDIIRTSYHTGPYEVVAVTPPKVVELFISDLFIFPWPVVSLTLRDAKNASDRGNYGISDIHREGDRYFSGGDEIFVEDPHNGGFHQIGLFGVEETSYATYAYQEGVNYEALDGELWKCGQCGKDYNGLFVPTVPDMVPGDPRGRRPTCPVCGGWPGHIYVVRPGEKWSTYMLYLQGRLVEQYNQFCPERLAYMRQASPPAPKKARKKKNV